MIVITRTKTEAEGSVKYECPERNDSLEKETKQPNLQKEERSDKSLRVVVVTKRGWVVNQINQTYFLKGLRMKKSVCLMAILGAFALTSANAASNQQTVDITFTGSVTESTCNIKLDNGQTSLYLGSIKKAGAQANQTMGTAVPLVFQVDNCTTETAVTNVELVEDLTMDNRGNSDLAKGILATNKDFIGVKISKNEDGSQPGVELIDKKQIGAGPTQGVELKKGGATVRVGYARLLALKGANDMQATDDIKAKAMFRLTFN